MTEKQRALSSRISQPNDSSHAVLSLAGGIGLGAGLMYVLDPDRGNRRRAMARQKLYRLVHLTGDAVDKGVRDLEHRAEGLVAETARFIRRERVPDDILEQRVRAKLGRVACHPSSIEVSASNGQVVLSGPVLRGETEPITRAVRHVRGVQGVEPRLEEHDSSENVPGLQGRCERPGDRPELLQENWAPGTRLVMGGLGLALALRAIRNPGFLNTVAGVLGVGLLARSGRHTRVVDTLVDTMRPGAGPRRHQQHDQATENPRRDVVGRSGVYPATGPFPPRAAEVRTAGSFGGGNYGEHGSSEMSYRGGAVLGALTDSSASSENLLELLKPGEIARENWLGFFNQLDKELNGEPVTVELREGGQSRIAQRDMPIDGFGADVKARELMISVSVGQTKDDMVIHTISAQRVNVRDGGEQRLVEIEGIDGRVLVVSFRNQGLRPKRVVA